MIAQTIAANALPAAARIAAIAVIHVLRFIAFHGQLNLLLQNNNTDMISEHIIAELLAGHKPCSNRSQSRSEAQP
jgi:hypothetical protein